MGKNETESTMKWKLDITDLKKNIQEANREMKISNSEFKAATASMDDWSKSADGLGAKILNLNDRYNSQGKILDSLKDQYNVIANEYGENSKQAQDLLVKINNQSAAMQKTQKEIDRYSTELSNMQNSSIATKSKLTELTETITRQENNLEKLKSQYQESVLSQGKHSDSSKELTKKIEQLSSELQKNKNDLKDAAYASDDLSESVENAGNSAEEAEGGFTILKGALASLAADVIRSAIDGFKELATEEEHASAQFQASTGASTTSMKAYNDEMKELYRNNYGDSLDDIANSMAEVKKQTNEVDPSTLKELTKNAIALRDTFGYETQETMRAVKMLMDQFGLSAEQAFNLVAQGAQKGLDKNGDLLDSINEYSVHYATLGYDADQFFNTLENGTKAGTFSVDKLGDATKEFGIRVKDTANSTTEGFELVGLNADEMREKFAQGGDSAKQATQETINALFSLDDKIKQNQAGVDLFGTMWEDLGIEGIRAITNINGTMDSTMNTMKQINDVKYSDVGSQCVELGRKVKTDLLMPIAEELLPVSKDFVSWTTRNLPTLIPIAKNVGVAFATAMAIKTVVSFENSILDAGKVMVKVGNADIPILSGAVGKLGTLIVANPWIALGVAIAGVASVIGILAAKTMAENNEHKIMMDSIQDEIDCRQELIDQQNEQLAGSLGEIKNLQSLNSELHNLVDAQGVVKEGNEARVKFILGELNDALGTEMTLNDGVVQGYVDVAESIDMLLQKKRAEIILESQIAKYKDAVLKSQEAQAKANELEAELTEKNIKLKANEAELTARYGSEWKKDLYSRPEIMKDSLFQQWSLLSADSKRKQDEYDAQNNLLKGYHEDIDSYEINSMRLQSGNAEEYAKIEVSNITTKHESYEQQKKDLQSKIDFEKAGIEKLKEGYTEGTDAQIDAQIRAKEGTISALEEQMIGLETTIEEHKFPVVDKFNAIAQSAISAITGTDFRSAGVSAVTNVASGVSESTSMMEVPGNNVATSFYDAANSLDTEPIGRNYVQGIINGANVRSVFNLGTTVGKTLIEATRAALDEHSPSKEGEQIGDFYVQGIAGGVTNSAKKLMNSAIAMGSDLINETKRIAKEASAAMVLTSYGVNSINTLPTNSPNFRNIQAANTTTTHSVVFTQNNYSPKALSQLEIYKNTNNMLIKSRRKVK